MDDKQAKSLLELLGRMADALDEVKEILDETTYPRKDGLRAIVIDLEHG